MGTCTFDSVVEDTVPQEMRECLEVQPDEVRNKTDSGSASEKSMVESEASKSITSGKTISDVSDKRGAERGGLVGPINAGKSDQESSFTKTFLQSPPPLDEIAHGSDLSSLPIVGGITSEVMEEDSNCLVQQGVSEDNQPTDEGLSEALKELIAGDLDLRGVNAKQVRSMLEKQYSCSLLHRKTSITAMIVQALQDKADESNDESEAGDDTNADSSSLSEGESPSTLNEMEEGDENNPGEESGFKVAKNTISHKGNVAPHIKGKRVSKKRRQASSRRAQMTAQVITAVRNARSKNNTINASVSGPGSDSDLSTGSKDSTCQSHRRAKGRGRMKVQGSSRFQAYQLSKSSSGSSDGSSSCDESGKYLPKMRGEGKRRRSQVKLEGSSKADSSSSGSEGRGGKASKVRKAPIRAAAKKCNGRTVAQEELEDASVELQEKRKRAATERQHQMDALRVMGPAEREELTKEKQSEIVRKIKEKQQRVHAALAASVQEELARLEVGKRAERSSVEGGTESEEGDGAEEAMASEALGEKEEELVAAAVAASTAARGESSDNDTEEGEASDQDVDGDHNTGGSKHIEVGDKLIMGERLADSESADLPIGKDVGEGGVKEEEGDSDVEESDDDSDSELEIISSTTSRGSSITLTTPTKTKLDGGTTRGSDKHRGSTRSNKRSGNVEEMLTSRAVASLPKGMRFGSPNSAEKSRGALRRQLKASVRTVASDRWAGQLGYQDGQEHIQDLKYMELKRRQQAQLDRECRERQRAALAARLAEYHSHANDEEDEFDDGNGNNPGKEGVSDADSDVETADATTKPSPTVTLDGLLGEAKAEAVTPAFFNPKVVLGGSAQTVSTNITIAASTTAIHGSVSKGEGGTGDKAQDEFDDGHFQSNSGAADGPTIANPFVPNPSISSIAAPSAAVADPNNMTKQRATEPEYEEKSMSGEETQHTTTDKGIRQGVGKRRALSTSSTSSDLVPDYRQGVATSGVTHDPSSLPLQPKLPAVVRTYGRKERDANGNVVSKEEAGMGAPQEVAMERGVTAAMGAKLGVCFDSQALWQEEPDSEIFSKDPAGEGGDGCSMSLNIEDDEETQGVLAGLEARSTNPGDGAGEEVTDSSGQHLETMSVATGVGENGTLPVTGKREATGSPDSVSPRTIECLSQGKVKGSMVKRPGQEGTKIKLGGGVAVVPTPSQPKMRLNDDGVLEAAPPQRTLASFFTGAAMEVTSSGDSLAPLLPQKPSLEKKGIKAFFCNTGATTSAEAPKAASVGVAVDGATSDSTPIENNVGINKERETDEIEKSEEEAVHQANPKKMGCEDLTQKLLGDSGISNGEGDNAVVGAGDGKEEEREEVAEPKDRAANFRAMLEQERMALLHTKKLRKAGFMDEEAEEEEEEEAVRGLGDFGFGVPAGKAGGTGEAGVGDNGEEEDDDEIQEKDLEGIVDTFSDDEGDIIAQDSFLNQEAANSDRQALKDMVRRVREGFGDERGSRRSRGLARGNLRLDELTAADRSSRKEARRLGLLNSDEEWSDDERGKVDENEEDELDEQALGEMLAREQRARHMGLSQTAQEYLDSSSDEEDATQGEEEPTGKGSDGAEEEERKEEERMQKLWVKRAKRRRVLAEVEESSTGDSQCPGRLLQEDEDSQAILSLLQCTNSRGGGSLARASSLGGSGSGNSRSDAEPLGKKGSQEFSGELNAGEIADGFGMGMSSKSLKRSKSTTIEASTSDKTGNTLPAESLGKRAFSLPQLVGSMGYGGSTRARQVQRKGSFLSRSRSGLSRSGSLASGKTTVSAAKFVFMSSSEDSSTRTGFEDPPINKQGGDADSGSGGRLAGKGNLGRQPSQSSTTRVDQSRGGDRINDGIGHKRKAKGEAAGGAAGKGRLWKGLCASQSGTDKK